MTKAALRMKPSAIVINIFYTGLGIARSLGRRGVPVIGLTSQRGIYGNYTRYADVRMAPDSRSAPEELLQHLLTLAKELRGRGIIFPTRDDDVAFLDRYREELEPWFSLVLAPRPAVRVCLDKWETYRLATRSGVATPRCWRISSQKDLGEAAREATFPCVLKPMLSHHWRQGANWELVGARKAIGIASESALFAEYATVARAGPDVLLQEMIPGADDCLVIAACYMDRRGNWASGFNTQKLRQAPEEFGTGCVVQAVDRPELFPPTRRLLTEIGYTGIAEVEYKWDARDRAFKLIEINPRPWDQHTLGPASGVDLMYLAYCDHAGLPMPLMVPRAAGHKWIAEDAFLTEAVRLAWRRNGAVRRLIRLGAGRRIYAISSWRDPVPMVAYAATRYLPGLIGAVGRALAWRLNRVWRRVMVAPERSLV